MPIGSYNATFQIPSVEDVLGGFDVPVASKAVPDSGEIVCLGGSSYGGFENAARDSHCRLCLRMGYEIGPNNVWLLPTKSRMPYPYSSLFSIASMMMTEKVQGRKADWFFWLDDDVLVQPDVYSRLRAVADAQDRPFVAAVGIDRFPPFRVAAWSQFMAGEVVSRKQWIVPDGPCNSWKYELAGNEMWMPIEGVHEVSCTGLCAAIFHRSLFDRVPQPWFAATPGTADEKGVEHRLNPDAWWCQKLNEAGIKAYVDASTAVVHIGDKIPVAIETVPIFRNIFRKR